MTVFPSWRGKAVASAPRGRDQLIRFLGGQLGPPAPTSGALPDQRRIRRATRAIAGQTGTRGVREPLWTRIVTRREMARRLAVLPVFPLCCLMGLLGAQVAGDPLGVLRLLVLFGLSTGLERSRIVRGIVPRIVEAADGAPHREGLVAAGVALGWH